MPTYDEFVEEIFYFPSFLQGDDEFDVAEDRSTYRDTANWCLFGEIITVKTIPRLTLVCRDKKDWIFHVRFDLDGDAQVERRRFMPGHTVAVLNTIAKRFLDGTYWMEGVYVKKLENCRDFPMELSELFQMNTELVKYTDGIDKQKDTRPCGACGKEGQELKKCGGCGYYYYCDAACQKTAWKRKNHKNECKVLKDPNMKMLLNLKAATEPLRFTN
ncbi:hypothetical protein BDP55DRAFT_726667 [Colletotrichum godetiae]|uniref:MYND-type domain-containing protein n=1 Tax=Colletotrichum godetiae TaxID=1209918 RepID=A0AAJ0AQ39_9PEZI|nr:uncharacterized protein BDP55DRAFT_726667 [Colletotrichum godetiae]KAK1688296.1 hypothetical protein BDP55DRAFT_726667 [Colletotrichum godetiae]